MNQWSLNELKWIMKLLPLSYGLVLSVLRSWEAKLPAKCTQIWILLLGTRINANSHVEQKLIVYLWLSLLRMHRIASSIVRGLADGKQILWGREVWEHLSGGLFSCRKSPLTSRKRWVHALIWTCRKVDCVFQVQQSYVIFGTSSPPFMSLQSTMNTGFTWMFKIFNRKMISFWWR